MSRNPVQFQKEMSDADFDRLYGTEAQCRDAIFVWRWPEGFVCPTCGSIGIVSLRLARPTSVPHAVHKYR